MEFSSEKNDQSLLETNQHYASPSAQSLLVLCFTIVLEVIGTLSLKYSIRDARIYMFAFPCYFSSLMLFSHVLRFIPLSIAYTTWCTFGTVGVCVTSSVIYDESLSITKWVCILMTIPCVIGMYIL